MHIPPILRGTTFVGMERYANHTLFVFASNDRDIRGDGYVRVKVITKGRPTFLYTLFDPGTNTIRHFEGPDGDPDKDGYEILAASG